MSAPSSTFPDRSIRLQKALADAGVAARRDCERLILDGRVRVNGSAVTSLPAFIDPHTDVVEIDGTPVDLSASETPGGARHRAKPVYLLVHKPKGMITTTQDPQGRPNVMSLVPRSIALRGRVFPVGRLDADSTGLLLLTNDGELAHRMSHPRFGLTKEYRVLTTGLATAEQIATLRKGMRLTSRTSSGERETRRAAMDEVRIVKRHVDRSRGDRTLLCVTLREGQNREIRRMLARVGLKVRELERVAIGPLRAPELKPGRVRLLGRKEVERLRAATLGDAAPAGSGSARGRRRDS